MWSARKPILKTEKKHVQPRVSHQKLLHPNQQPQPSVNK